MTNVRPKDAAVPVDEELLRVQNWFRLNDPAGSRTMGVLRESLDQVLDGPRTRRFKYSDLRKTEKTHVGTIVEINLGKAFALSDGVKMDYTVAGVDVDCKYSMFMWGWEFPLESIGHIVLLTWANDDSSRWSAGLWRVNEEHLPQNGKGNRDKKRKMLKSGRDEIFWLWQNQTLDENLLLHLDPADTDAIFSQRSGMQALNELFRRVQGRIVRREVVLTVGQQRDSPRRARQTRERKHLGKEGIIVLGHYEWDVAVAARLNLPVPKNGEWVAARVTPDESATGSFFEAEGVRWRLAVAGDNVVPAPVIPRSKLLDNE